MSSIELHEFSANKRAVKTDQFQFCMHPVTASLLNSVVGAGGVGSWVVWVHKILVRLKKWLEWHGWCRYVKFGVDQNKLWIENFIHNTHATHATQAIYQTRLLQIKSQAVVNSPLARKSIFKTSISISTKIIQYVKSYLINSTYFYVIQLVMLG